jgi:ribonuclease-3
MDTGANKIKGMWRMNNQLTNELKDRYGIVFHDVNLLEQAFTHSSYVNEHRYLKLSDNERLEFLGDAVLELIVSQYLYEQFPELPEGKLTKMRAAIVREDSLSKFAKECHFDQYILLGKGEEASGGRKRPALLCDLFESFLGALYLDQQFGAAKRFIEQVIFPKIDAGAFSHEMDHKTHLQEVLQRQGDVTIEYRLVKEEGPAHDRVFSTEVYVDGKLIGIGQGKSKKLAEQDAAERALKNIPQ